MRFLLFSDVHLHMWKLGNSYQRLFNQINMLKDMVNYAKEKNINNILFCGDLFHTHGNLRVEVVREAQLLFSYISNLGIKVIGLPGNHDQSGKDQQYNSISLIPSIINLEYSSYKPKDIPHIVGIPFTENEEVLKQNLLKVPSDSILLMHQGVSGVEFNSKGFTLNEILKPEMVPNRVLIAFSGHYHSFKRIGKLIVPGAMMQHNFGDAGDCRGFLDVSDETGKLAIKHIPSPELFKIIDFISLDSFEKEMKVFLNFKPNNHEKFVKVINVPIKFKSFFDEYPNTFNVNIQTIYETNETKRIKDLKETPSISNVVEQFISTQENLSERRLEVGMSIIKGTYL